MASQVLLNLCLSLASAEIYFCLHNCKSLRITSGSLLEACGELAISASVYPP
jgi:hypothetical protein